MKALEWMSAAAGTVNWKTLRAAALPLPRSRQPGNALRDPLLGAFLGARHAGW